MALQGLQEAGDFFLLPAREEGEGEIKIRIPSSFVWHDIETELNAQIFRTIVAILRSERCNVDSMSQYTSTTLDDAFADDLRATVSKSRQGFLTNVNQIC